MVKGYKVFNPDWTCSPEGNTKQYSCPGKFEEDVKLNVCGRDMHFCKRAADCFSYYTFTPDNHVAEVIAYGDIKEDDYKCCTDKLEIVREISWTELLEIVNTGKGCTGLGNSGDHNSGYCNSGNRNSGDHNSGYCNSGDHNSGDHNSGYCNSGDYNSGDYNSGSYNRTNFSNGCFNTFEPKIYLFNKPSEWTYTDWLTSAAWALMRKTDMGVPRWITSQKMSDEEKQKHPEYETTGGYLRSLDNKDCRIAWWHRLSENEKDIIKAIPNFDKDIFKEITGIDVDEKKG